MSSSIRYPYRHGEPETYRLRARITGTGAADPTMSVGGNGFAVAWISTGLYEVTFAGQTVNVFADRPAFWADTLTDVDGWDVVFKAYNPTTRKIRFSVVNQAQTLADLPVATGLHLGFDVKLTAAAG